LIGGEAGYGERRSLGEREGLRHSGDQGRRNDDRLRISLVASGVDTVTDVDSGDAIPHGVDDPAHVPAEHEGRRSAEVALPQLHVHRIEADGADADANFAGSGRSRGELLRREAVDAAEFRQ
jgi:hypothetical protein